MLYRLHSFGWERLWRQLVAVTVSNADTLDTDIRTLSTKHSTTSHPQDALPLGGQAGTQLQKETLAWEWRGRAALHERFYLESRFVPSHYSQYEESHGPLTYTPTCDGLAGDPGQMLKAHSETCEHSVYSVPRTQFQKSWIGQEVDDTVTSNHLPQPLGGGFFHLLPPSPMEICFHTKKCTHKKKLWQMTLLTEMRTQVILNICILFYMWNWN